MDLKCTSSIMRCTLHVNKLEWVFMGFNLVTQRGMEDSLIIAQDGMTYLIL